MYRKAILSFVFAIGMVAILGTESMARVCTLRSTSGTCLFWSGSVECDLNADQVGSLKDKPELTCSVQPTGDGAILCGNPGSKQKPASGVQIVFISSSSVPTFSKSELIEKGEINNGVAYKVVTAEPSAFVLSQLNSFCKNTGWVVLDYVPCQANIEAKQSDNLGSIDAAMFNCNLDCSALTFTGSSFDRLPYQCTQQ
jgi:hypothetical protein